MKLPADVPAIEWVEDNYPISGPQFTPSRIRWVTLHYPWVSAVPNVRWRGAWLRAMQRDYVNRRNFSVGYNYAIFPDGEIWELRGTRYRCAANGTETRDTNIESVAILLVVADDDPATDAQIASVRAIVAAGRITRPELAVNAHQDVRSTGCPGEGIYTQLTDGLFEPSVNQNETEVEMRPVLWSDERYHDVFLVYPNVTALSPKLADVHRANGAVHVVDRHRKALVAFARQAQITSLTDRNWRSVDVATIPERPD